jgi:hypothetical protein
MKLDARIMHKTNMGIVIARVNIIYIITPMLEQSEIEIVSFLGLRIRTVKEAERLRTFP